MVRVEPSPRERPQGQFRWKSHDETLTTRLAATTSLALSSMHVFLGSSTRGLQECAMVTGQVPVFSVQPRSHRPLSCVQEGSTFSSKTCQKENIRLRRALLFDHPAPPGCSALNISVCDRVSRRGALWRLPHVGGFRLYSTYQQHVTGIQLESFIRFSTRENKKKPSN